MRNLLCGFVAALSIGGLALSGWSWERGTTGADYLKIGLGADAVGMGEAYTASSGEVTSMFYNPAGLAAMDASQLTATHLNWIADTQYEALAFARPDVDFGTVGVGVFLLHMPPIAARDEYNHDQGTVNVSDLGVQVSYAKDMQRWLGVSGLSGGASLKILHRELAGQAASGGALDIGALYALDDHITLGLSCLNAGYLSKFGSEQDYLPFVVRLGTAYAYSFAAGQKVVAALDLTQSLDNQLRSNVGLEYTLLNLLHARAGYKFGYDSDAFQAGLGVGWQAISVDYAIKLMGVFGPTHYVSASMTFGAKIVEQQQDRGQELLKTAERLYEQSKYPEALKAAEEAVLINPKSVPAQQLRDKLKTVLDMLQIPADPNAPAPTETGQPLSKDDLEERAPTTPQEVQP